MSFIEQFGLLIIIVAVISLIVKLLRQPIIIGYVISGLLFLYLSETSTLIKEDIIALSEIGIAFLLFLMGLQFDFRSLKHMGKDIFIVILKQSVVFFAIPFCIMYFLGFGTMPSIYISIVFMFSSTLLVAKWVEDKKEGNTFHGKIIITTLILQDIITIAALTALSITGKGLSASILLVPLKGILLIGIAALVSRYGLNRILKFSSKYPELLFMISISTCFFFGILAPLLGYSSTIGAFIGGIVLANTIYRVEIAARLKPLIVFFNMLFFVGIGFQMDLGLDLKTVFVMAGLLAAGLVIKPIITYWTLRKLGYDPKASFMSGLYLAQFTELGIIIVAEGIIAGRVGGEIGSMAIILVIMSMLISSYFIKYSSRIYAWCVPIIRIFDKKMDLGKELPLQSESWDYNVLFFGYHDLSKELIEKMKGLSKKLVVVESDPNQIRMLKNDGWNYIYNSVNNPDFFHHIDFTKVELVVSNSTDLDENMMILTELKKANPQATAIHSAKSVRDSMALYNANADHVIFTSYLNNQQVSVLLEEYTNDIGSVIGRKLNEITRLKALQEKRGSTREAAFFDIDEFMKMITVPHVSDLKDIGRSVGKVFRPKKTEHAKDKDRI